MTENGEVSLVYLEFKSKVSLAILSGKVDGPLSARLLSAQSGSLSQANMALISQGETF